MKGKSEILKYIAAIMGCVLGAYLFVSNNGVDNENLNSAIGFIVMIVCLIYILGHSINSYLDASEKRREEKLAEKERYQEQKRQKLKEKEDKYNAFRNELIARNGEPGRVVLIHESRFDQFNMDNELIVFDKVKKLWLCGHEIAIGDINSFMVDDESTILKGDIKAVTSTNTGSLAGRSIAGALIGGEAGAIIGGATAKKETIFRQENDKVIHDYALVVNVCDLNNPMLLIKIGRDKKKAMEINALMQVVMSMK